MAKAKDEKTLVEHRLDWFQNHKIFAWIVLAGVVVISLGAVAGGVGQLTDLWHRIRGDSAPAAQDSVTVNLPSGLNFKQAISLLSQNAQAAARFDRACPPDLLNAPVKAGAMKGARTIDLMEQIRDRMPTRLQDVKYRINVLMSGGIYEVSCSG